MTYTTHTEETAPDAARPFLAGAKKKFGFVPNLLGTMASAPALLKGYLTMAEIFDGTSLTPTERQIVLLSTSRSNGCAYCMAAHTVIAGMQQVPNDVVTAVRDNTPIGDAKLDALRVFAMDVVERRGHPSEETLNRFLSAGYTQAQILEVVLGIGFKTLSNYTNHIAHTPLDPAFASAAWTEEDKKGACTTSCNCG